MVVWGGGDHNYAKRAKRVERCLREQCGCAAQTAACHARRCDIVVVRIDVTSISSVFLPEGWPRFTECRVLSERGARDDDDQ